LGLGLLTLDAMLLAWATLVLMRRVSEAEHIR